MSNEDGTAWIIFNGEVYNHRDLRPVLEAKGHRFRTVSDTEVILHAYEEFGTACVERLEGMFAFAIYDSRRAELFIARDRLGQEQRFSTAPAGSIFPAPPRRRPASRVVHRARSARQEAALLHRARGRPALRERAAGA